MPSFIADTFLTAMSTLTSDERAAVATAVFDLLARPDHPSLQLHRVQGPDEDMWSARVSRDLRLILNKRGDATVVCHVDHHDGAYAWARRRRLEAHETTGAAQFVVIDERTEEVVKQVARVVVEDDVKPERPFAHLDDAALLAFGVPRGWLAAVRHATLDAFLGSVGADLPSEAQELLLRVATGETPDVPEPPTRGRDPFTHPDARRRFYLLDEHDQAIRQALAEPWDAWRLFLHPTQRSAVEADHAGPSRVTGGPGTGKSVVAVHRAAHLARAGGRVLLTSFSRTLAERLAHDVDRLLAGDPETRGRIDVVHLHQLAVERWKAHHGAPPRVVKGDELQSIVEQAITETQPADFTAAFVAAEWDGVVDPYGIHTWTEYADVDRVARGTPLNNAQRQTLWPTLARVRALLTAQGLHTWSDLCWDATERLDASADLPYRHVIADEVQDFGPAELRLLRALVPEGRNDVCLAGDSHQRIYKPRVGFARAGLEVRGRTTVLRLNYRTTEQIRRSAERLQHRGTDSEDRPAVSLLAGPEPEIRRVNGVTDEIRTVTNWLQKLVSTGYRPGEIAIFARTHQLLRDRARPAIANAGLQAHELAEQGDPAPNRIAIGTMHRSKGLQYRAVAIVGAEAGEIPLERVLDRQANDSARAAFLELERNLLYVA